MRVTLKLRTSYRLAALLAIAHAGAGAAFIAAALGAAWSAAAVAGLGASLWFSVTRGALLRGRHAIVAMEWNEGEHVAVQTGDGRWHEARVLPATFVSPSLTVLALRIAGLERNRHVVLLADSAAADDYRRLRVRLLWSRAPTG